MSMMVRNILGYIHNRWINPADRVVIRHEDYPRGTYFDTDTTMLYAMFQLLVDFVEIECGPRNNSTAFDTCTQKFHKKLDKIPGLSWFLPPTRNVTQGLHHLRWAMKLKDMPSQAAHAKEVFRLYKWWKHTRPERREPWTQYYSLRETRDWRGSLTPNEKKLMDKCAAIEEKYEREDDRNLHALLKIRKGLWT